MVPPVRHFAEGCRAGELRYTVDPDGIPVWPPRAGLEWRVSTGHGTVYATAVVRPRDGEPRDLSLIELDEGFRMMSRVEGIPTRRGRDRRARRRSPGPRTTRHCPSSAAGRPRDRPDRRSPGRRGRASAQAPEGATPEDLMARGVAGRAGRVRPRAARRRRPLRRLDPAADGLALAGRGAAASSRATPTRTQIGGSSPLAHLQHARAAIDAGLCDVALIAYGSTQRSVGRGTALGPARSRRGRSPTARRCRSPPTRWPPRATCTSSARRASSSPRSRSPRGRGRAEPERAPGRATP